MFLKFEKWHGCLNDFAVVWLSDLDGDVVLDSVKRQAKSLCHRQGGIGADGILILQTRQPDDILPYRLVIINSDGSLAKNCGNGLRCAAASVYKKYKAFGSIKEKLEAVALTVDDHTYDCRFMSGHANGYPLIAVDMGQPALNRDNSWHDDAKRAVSEVLEALKLKALKPEVGTCQLGNQHIVGLTDAASSDHIRTIGSALQHHEAWDGINVHLAASFQPDDKDLKRAHQEVGGPISEIYKAYVWERGAGETMACGSGACAVAAIALQSGLLDRNEWLAIDMPGGRVYVKHDQDDAPMILAGPVNFVFSGQVEI